MKRMLGGLKDIPIRIGGGCYLSPGLGSLVSRTLQGARWQNPFPLEGGRSGWGWGPSNPVSLSSLRCLIIMVGLFVGVLMAGRGFSVDPGAL